MMLKVTTVNPTEARLNHGKMVEIFRTNVVKENVAEQLISMLHAHLPDHHFNFDLEDCDRILRVETLLKPVKVSAILKLMISKGVVISWLSFC
jgi:hypothetical protein